MSLIILSSSKTHYTNCNKSVHDTVDTKYLRKQLEENWNLVMILWLFIGINDKPFCFNDLALHIIVLYVGLRTASDNAGN